MAARSATALALVCLCFCLCFCLGPTSAAAQTQPDGDDATVVLHYSLKNSALWSRLPGEPAPVPDRDRATGFWRLRVEPTIRWGEDAAFELAFEQRVRAFSSVSSAAGAGILPSEVRAPFRVRQLDWRFASASHAEWRGEIDRAALHVRLADADVTIGRQAIGWGRSALFGAVDLFAPFTPLEADREWRRGVDAVRGEVKLGDRVSIDSVAAFDATLAGSIFAARLRGVAGKADVEIVGGYRARDLFAGMTSSAAVGDVEVHGELALFRTDAVTASPAFGDRRLVAKAVAGGSYRFAIGNGVLIHGEYHYSGFGAPSPEQILVNIRDPAFQERYLRGDTQILGRHALAVVASYEVVPEVAVSSQWLQSPADGSAVVVSSGTWTINDRWSLVVSGYVPYGRGSDRPTLGSEFGATPTAVFVQIKMYR